MNMVSVQEVFQLAIETEMVHLAHRIFWAITNGKVKAQEDSSDSKPSTMTMRRFRKWQKKTS